jgi:hypothetical protein
MANQINNDTGTAVTKDEFTAAGQQKYNLDYKGREAYLVVRHYDSAVYATVALDGREYDFDDWHLDEGFKDRWNESAKSLFGGDFLSRADSLTLPDEFVAMAETMLGDLDLVIGGAQ